MIKFNFEIPIYKVEVNLIQVMSDEDSKEVEQELLDMEAQKEDIDTVIEDIVTNCRNGGYTFRNLDKKKFLVIFCSMDSDRVRAEVYAHEKRHIEDRLLAAYNIDDIESAGLLAGFLGEKFYDFTKLVEDECFEEKSDCD